MTDWTRKYLVFEQNIINEADDLFQEEGGQAERDLILRIRIACKDYWLDKDRPLPCGLDFEDPDAPEPAQKVKRKGAAKA